ncbi:hypothetical protein SLA2020_281180 [Shorea laevis]
MPNVFIKPINLLDENLQREVVKYGKFIQATYHAIHSDPAMSAQGLPSRVTWRCRTLGCRSGSTTWCRILAG